MTPAVAGRLRGIRRLRGISGVPYRCSASVVSVPAFPGRMVLPTAVQPGFRAKRKVTVER